MPYRCVCWNCSNSTPDFTLFSFPKQTSQATLWHRFVTQTREWDLTIEQAIARKTAICQAHFEETCFDPIQMLKHDSGIYNTPRLKLLPGSVPSIHKLCTTADTENVVTNRRSREAVVNKMEKLRFKQRIEREMAVLRAQLNEKEKHKSTNKTQASKNVSDLIASFGTKQENMDCSTVITENIKLEPDIQLSDNDPPVPQGQLQTEELNEWCNLPCKIPFKLETDVVETGTLNRSMQDTNISLEDGMVSSVASSNNNSTNIAQQISKLKSPAGNVNYYYTALSKTNNTTTIQISKLPTPASNLNYYCVKGDPTTMGLDLANAGKTPLLHGKPIVSINQLGKDVQCVGVEQVVNSNRTTETRQAMRHEDLLARKQESESDVLENGTLDESGCNLGIAGPIERVVWKNDNMSVTTQDLGKQTFNPIMKKCKVVIDRCNLDLGADGVLLKSDDKMSDSDSDSDSFEYTDKTKEDPDFEISMSDQESSGSSESEDDNSLDLDLSKKKTEETLSPFIMVELNDEQKSKVRKYIADLVEVITVDELSDVTDPSSKCYSRCRSKRCKTHINLPGKHNHYVCKNCHVEMHCVNSIRIHISQHEIQRVKICQICDAEFSTSSNYMKHKREAHTLSNKLFKCDYNGCNYAVKCKSRVQRHKRNVHEGALKVVCTWEGCGQTFKTPYALRVHRRIHTGHKPYLCFLCAYSCRQKASLNWHMKSKHPGEHFHKDWNTKRIEKNS